MNVAERLTELDRGLSALQRELDTIEGQQRANVKQRDALLAELEKEGLTLETSEVWLEEKDQEASRLLDEAETLKVAAAAGVDLIRRAQAGEEVDLSPLLGEAEEEAESELP